MEISLTKVMNGIYDVHVISNDEYIGPTIARGREWDGWMRGDIRRCHKPDTEIIDVGANIGYNTLMFPITVQLYHLNPCFMK